MRILFCSLSDRPEFSGPIYDKLKEYCSYHNYKCVIEDKVLDDSRAPPWSKILLLQREMKNNEDYDYIIWIDDDILITDKNKKFEEFIEKYSSAHDIFVSEDAMKSYPMNTGIIVCKNKNETLKYLEHIWELCEKYPHSKNGGLWEQDVMTRDYETNKYVRIIPYRTIQSFYRTQNKDWSPTDFSAHFTGMPIETRIKMRDEVIERIKNL